MFVQAVPFALPTVRVFRRPVFNVQTVHGFRAKSGITGQADYYAIVQGGLHVEIETKAIRGRLSDGQIAWGDFCQRWRIPHLVLKPARGEPPAEAVERWIEELRAAIKGAS